MLGLDNHRTRLPLLLDGNVVGSFEQIYSVDGKKLMSKNATIKSGILPEVPADVEMLSLMYYAEKGERVDDYKEIPFP